MQSCHRNAHSYMSLTEAWQTTIPFSTKWRVLLAGNAPFCFVAVLPAPPRLSNVLGTSNPSLWCLFALLSWPGLQDTRVILSARNTSCCQHKACTDNTSQLVHVLATFNVLTTERKQQPPQVAEKAIPAAFCSLRAFPSYAC